MAEKKDTFQEGLSSLVDYVQRTADAFSSTVYENLASGKINKNEAEEELDNIKNFEEEILNLAEGKSESLTGFGATGKPDYGTQRQNTNLQRAISGGIRDLVISITNPAKSEKLGLGEDLMRRGVLQGAVIGLNKFGGLNIDRSKIDTVKDLLTDQNMVDIGKMSGIGQVKDLQEYYNKEGKLPSDLALLRDSYVPTGTTYKLTEDEELDAIDNPNLSSKRKATYDPITPANQSKIFSDREIKGLSEMLVARDKDKTNRMAVGEIDLDDFKEGVVTEGNYRVNKEGIQGKTLADTLDDSFGLAKYGHFDRMSGEWQAGIPDEEGNYTFKDDYNWNRGKNSGLSYMLEMIMDRSKAKDQDIVEGTTQITGPNDPRGEKREIEINVPTYVNDPMQQMNLLSSKFGSGNYYFGNNPDQYSISQINQLRTGYGMQPVLTEKEDPYYFVPGKETPLGQGDLPGIYWQEDAFMEGMPSANEDPGYYDEDVDLKGGGYIFREVNKLKMNDRNAKNNLYEMIGIKPVVAKQYGGGLSDAYSTLADRRQNMYGMGQTPSQMSSAFQDPMEASAFSPVNMEQGGDIVVPKERMINDQPHELSYINPQEAKLLKDLGGSGRRVDGIPAYYDTADAGDFMDDDSSSNSSDDSGNDTGPDVTAADAAQQAKDDAMYSQYAGGYSNQMSVDPDDPSGYLDSYGDEFGRNPDGTTKTRSQAIAENYQYGINNLLTKGYSEEKAKRFMDRGLAVPGGYDTLSRSYDLSRSPEQDIYDNYLSFAKNQLSPVMNLAKEKQEIANYYRDLKEDEETEQYKEPGFFDKAGNFFGNIVDTYKGKNQGLGQFLGDDTRTGAFGNRPSGVSGRGITTINEDPEDTENLQTIGENLGLEFSPTTAGERQAVGIASLIDPTGVLSVGQLAKGLLSGLTGDETVGTARDPITGELFSFSSKGNLAPISPEDDPGFANRDDEGNPAKILKKPIPLKPPVITEKEVEEKEEVTTDGKLSNRAKASAESIKSLIKLRNASSDAQIDAIISDLGIDKAGLTVSEFLKELGIER